MSNWIQEFKKAKTIDGVDKVIIPGEPETEMEVQRMKDGITLVDTIVEDLKKLGENFSVSL